MIAIKNMMYNCIVPLLPEAGLKDNDENTALFWSIICLNYFALKILKPLEQDIRDEFEQTPLMVAADLHHEKVIKMLLDVQGQ